MGVFQHGHGPSTIPNGEQTKGFSIYFPLEIDYNGHMDAYNKNNKENARINRKQRNATRQEGVLWHTYLKQCPINFARQYRLDNYILDFYAPSIKLAIEIDGGQHYEDKTKEYDNRRTSVLNTYGVQVMRLSNLDIDKHLRESIDLIVAKIEELKGNKIY